MKMPLNIELTETLNEFFKCLDSINLFIKHKEKELQSVPINVWVPFNDGQLLWDSQIKRICVYCELNKDKKPLIECKAEIRICCMDSVNELCQQANICVKDLLKKFLEKKS